MGDVNKTQHFTIQAQKICKNLIKYIPENAQLIEPFAGNEDLINLFPNSFWEKFDIEPVNNTIIKQDTLKAPPEYKGKWIITNPPYLAKNKAKDKSIYT